MDKAPAGECPRCHVFSIPFEPNLHLPRQRFAYRLHAVMRKMRFDGTAVSLIFANIGAVGIGYFEGMRLAQLLMVFWMQSVIILICILIRILSLKRFSRDPGTQWTYELGPDASLVGRGSAAIKRRIATSCVVFYGAWLGMTYFFLHVFAGIGLPDGEPRGYLYCTAVFAVNHLYSLRRNMHDDAAGSPNIDHLMMLPLVRTVPMHVMVFLGAFALKAGATTLLSLLIFVVLKICADVIMHCVERRVTLDGRLGQHYVG